MHGALREFNTKWGKVRHFSDQKIQEAVDDALSHVSEDKPLAAVGHVSNEGWKLSLAYRRGDTWTVAAALYRDWDGGDLTAEGKVVWTP